MAVNPAHLMPQDFIALDPRLVASLGGDVQGAVILTRLHYRAKIFGTDKGDGHPWWEVTQGVLAADTGLSVDQVRRTLTRLEGGGHIEREQARRGSTDQTRKYRVKLAGQAQSADPPSAESGSRRNRRMESAESPTVQSAESPTVPSIQEGKNNPPTPQPYEFGAASIAEAYPLPAITVPRGGVRYGDESIEAEVRAAEAGDTRDQMARDFDEFWQAFPVKEREVSAAAAYKQARTVTDHRTIMKGVRGYARLVQQEGREARYVTRPAQWLVDKRWTDEYPTGPKKHWAHTAADD